jgi:hypothetical protein
MKAKTILTNWALSLFALISIDADHSRLGVSLAVAGWFCVSCILLKYADRKGWMGFIKSN